VKIATSRPSEMSLSRISLLLDALHLHCIPRVICQMWNPAMSWSRVGLFFLFPTSDAFPQRPQPSSSPFPPCLPRYVPTTLALDTNNGLTPRATALMAVSMLLPPLAQISLHTIVHSFINSQKLPDTSTPPTHTDPYTPSCLVG
jgi:hypothetical protein